MTKRDEPSPNRPTDMEPTPDSLDLAIASFRGGPPGT